MVRKAPNIEPGAMPKLNSARSAPHSRDLGGVSSVVVLAFALVICLEWCLLMNMGS